MDTKKAANILKALSNPNRLELYLKIAEKQESRIQNDCECFVTDIISSLNIGAPTISHHIKELTNADLITTEKKGKFLICRANEAVIEEIKMLLSFKICKVDMFSDIDSVLFDMDGVLVDSEEVIEAAAIKGLSKYGINAVHEDFLPFVGAGEDKYIGGVSEKYGIPYRLEMKAQVYELYSKLVFEHIKVYEGIVELLKNLKIKGYKLALASSADNIKVKLNLQAAGIDDTLFEAIVCGSDVINKKPSPEVFLIAAERLRSNPKTCIVIEDAINGVKAAKAAGMKCIAITTSFEKSVLKEQGADEICFKTTDIDVLLKSRI